MSSGSKQEPFEELKSEFVAEFRRMQRTVHRLIDHLTAISGYTQMANLQAERQPLAELGKILSTVETSMVMLRNCLTHMKEVERRYS